MRYSLHEAGEKNAGRGASAASQWTCIVIKAASSKQARSGVMRWQHSHAARDPPSRLYTTLTSENGTLKQSEKIKKVNTPAGSQRELRSVTRRRCGGGARCSDSFPPITRRTSICASERSGNSHASCQRYKCIGASDQSALAQSLRLAAHWETLSQMPAPADALDGIVFSSELRLTFEMRKFKRCCSCIAVR